MILSTSSGLSNVIMGTCICLANAMCDLPLQGLAKIMFSDQTKQINSNKQSSKNTSLTRVLSELFDGVEFGFRRAIKSGSKHLQRAQNVHIRIRFDGVKRHHARHQILPLQVPEPAFKMRPSKQNHHTSFLTCPQSIQC
jgi:hypothetical protein